MIFNFILLPPAPCWKLPFLFQPTYPPDRDYTAFSTALGTGSAERARSDSELSQLLAVSSLDTEGLIFSLLSVRLNFVLASSCHLCRQSCTQVT